MRIVGGSGMWVLCPLVGHGKVLAKTEGAAQDRNEDAHALGTKRGEYAHKRVRCGRVKKGER